MVDIEKAIREIQKSKKQGKGKKSKRKEIPGDEGVIAGLRGLDQWRRAWSRAVAFAWESKTHEKLLLDHPEEVFHIFDYEVPEGLKIKVEKYKGNKKYKYKKGENGWLHMEKDLSGEVTMILPPAPEDKDMQGMALADYDATGKTYPFTCS